LQGLFVGLFDFIIMPFFFEKIKTGAATHLVGMCSGYAFAQVRPPLWVVALVFIFSMFLL
jgi:hypothetical protein